MHILIIEDDPYIANFLFESLIELGYRVTQANNGEEGVQLAISQPFDLVILDLMLPQLDGMEVLKRLRGEGHKFPILILSARQSVQEKVIGLQAGADDYLIKPFAFAELAVRCQILLRRVSTNTSNELLCYHDLSLDPITREFLSCRQRAHTVTTRIQAYAFVFTTTRTRVF